MICGIPPPCANKSKELRQPAVGRFGQIYPSINGEGGYCLFTDVVYNPNLSKYEISCFNSIISVH